jgi:eukaryotic-like serine/threonine-protein kinase
VTEPEVLAGRYELDEVLGTGGMALVYRGTDRVLHRTVAVKVLADPRARDPVFVERFRREARSAGGLNHPGIVAVYDTGSDQDRHFIVMEHVDGRTLAELLTRDEGRLSPRQTAHIVGQVASALAYAHENGVVHRDVKPANIMVTTAGDAKIMDFGIARATTGEPLTQTAAVMGTATYIAPEQAEGKPVDPRTDIYALGATMYQMLAGRPPFVADTPVAVASMHVHEQPEPPTSIDPSIPAPLEAIALRALEKDPGTRYQIAQDMRTDIDHFLEGEPLIGPPALGATAATAAVGAGAPTMFVDTSELEAGGGSRNGTRRRTWLFAGALIAALVIAAVAITLVAGAGGVRGPAFGGSMQNDHSGHRRHPPPSAPSSSPVPVIAPPSPSPSATPTPTPSPSPRPSPTPRSSPSPSPPPSPSPSPTPSPGVSPSPAGAESG